MPPPMPLTMPRTAAIGQLIPWSSAFWSRHGEDPEPGRVEELDWLLQPIEQLVEAEDHQPGGHG